MKLTKARSNFYLMKKTADSKTTFKFLNAKLYVIRIRPNPALLFAYHSALSKRGIERYIMTRVELKTFTFSSGMKSLSIDNTVLEPIPKRLLFTMVKNIYFLGSLDTNRYNFRHYDLNNFTLFVNGKQFPKEGLSLGMDHEKTSLFKESGIHH